MSYAEAINQAIGVIGFAMILAISEITIPYHRYARVLRWLCLSLLAYVAVLFVAKVDWGQVAIATAVPQFDFTRTSFEMLIALVLLNTLSILIFLNALITLSMLSFLI